MGTGIVLMLLLEGFGANKWAVELDRKWTLSYYGLVLLMPVGMLIASGQWLGVAVTGAAILAPWAAAGARAAFKNRVGGHALMEEGAR
jgi:hypothetical protein